MLPPAFITPGVPLPLISLGLPVACSAIQIHTLTAAYNFLADWISTWSLFEETVKICEKNLGERTCKHIPERLMSKYPLKESNEETWEALLKHCKKSLGNLEKKDIRQLQKIPLLVIETGSFKNTLQSGTDPIKLLFEMHLRLGSPRQNWRLIVQALEKEFRNRTVSSLWPITNTAFQLRRKWLEKKLSSNPYEPDQSKWSLFPWPNYDSRIEFYNSRMKLLAKCCEKLLSSYKLSLFWEQIGNILKSDWSNLLNLVNNILYKLFQNCEQTGNCGQELSPREKHSKDSFCVLN